MMRIWSPRTSKLGARRSSSLTNGARAPTPVTGPAGDTGAPPAGIEYRLHWKRAAGAWGAAALNTGARSFAVQRVQLRTSIAQLACLPVAVVDFCWVVLRSIKGLDEALASKYYDNLGTYHRPSWMGLVQGCGLAAVHPARAIFNCLDFLECIQTSPRRRPLPPTATMSTISRTLSNLYKVGIKVRAAPEPPIAPAEPPNR